MKSNDRCQVLVLTASYGAGHDSAASAVVEACHAEGLRARLIDPFAYAKIASYGAGRAFYQFCVLHAPRVWSWIYEQVDRWDWHQMVSYPPHSRIKEALQELLESSGAQLVICTYPLFSYMIDQLRQEGKCKVAHMAVVTDAMGVSRIWLRSHADAICVTDDETKNYVTQRYALDARRVHTTSFPTKVRFYPNKNLAPPQQGAFAILYAAQAPLAQVKEELQMMISRYPQVQITLLGGKRYEPLRQYLSLKGWDEQIHLIERSAEMDELMRRHHLYIGKAGGATTFEAYACAIPMVINYAHLEQELGNVQLLQLDGCGIHAEGAVALQSALHGLFKQDAQQWRQMRDAMLQLPRRGGAQAVVCLAKKILAQELE